MNHALKIFVDADAFIASIKTDDPNHEKAKKLFKRLEIEPLVLITSNYVFSECITVLSQRINHPTAIEFINTMRTVDGPFVITRVDEVIEESAIEIFKKQTSKNTSFVDCTNMALIKSDYADAIFSFDGVYVKNNIKTVEDILD